MSEKKIKEKYIYEIWTFYTTGAIFEEEKKGICHGRFLKKEKAEEALKTITKARGGKSDSIFSDGDKKWHFRIVKYKINDFDNYCSFYNHNIAVYDDKKKYWYCLNLYGERIQIPTPTVEILNKINRWGICSENKKDGFDDELPF